jgi:hypothetical protein
MPGVRGRPHVTIVERVTFERVRLATEQQHDERHPSLVWALRNLALADAQFQGCWSRATIDAIDARHIVLPRHAGEPCHGDHLELIPAGGATVEDAVRRLRGLSEYAAVNVSCWGKIEFFTSQPLSPIVLASAPLDHADYRDLPPWAPAYHVDGLHRLIGWGLAGRLDEPDRLDVWLAGPQE